MERLPGPVRHRGDVLQVRRCQAQPDAGVGKLGMRIETAVEFADRLGVHVTGLCIDQRAFLVMRLEQAFGAHEERRAVMPMPVGVAERRDFGVEHEDLGLRVLRQKGIHAVEQHATFVLLAGLKNAVELQLEIRIVVGVNHVILSHGALLPPPRVAQPVMRPSIAPATAYIAIPMAPVTRRPAKASGTSKREDATSMKLPMPALEPTVSAMIEPTKATVIATFSDAKK